VLPDVDTIFAQDVFSQQWNKKTLFHVHFARLPYQSGMLYIVSLAEEIVWFRLTASLSMPAKSYV